MSYLYYPGCSLRSSGRAYEESLLAVFRALDVPLVELPDWNCCGATAYMSVDEQAAFSVAVRNLALAEQERPDGAGAPVDLLAPCSACYLVLNKAEHYMKEYPQVGSRIQARLERAGLSYRGRTRVRHPLDVLLNDVGLERLRSKLRAPLAGLRVASYYGCQIVRPYATFDDQHDPTSLDRLMQALGAEPVDWPLKTRCCGGSLTGTIPDVGLRLSWLLVGEARKRRADVVATCCPLCQFNLECYQDRLGREQGEPVSLPIAFFTQLMGIALGLRSKELGLGRLFVPVEPAVARRQGVVHV